MLQRLIYRTPSPTRLGPNSKHLFNREGKLRDHIVPICHELKIDPNELYPKVLEDFADSEVHKNVQVLRFNHYEAKRQAKINYVKSKLSRKAHNKDKLLSVQTSPNRATNRNPSLITSPLGLPGLGSESNRHTTFTTLEKPGSFFFTDVAGYRSTRIMPSIVENDESSEKKFNNVRLNSGPMQQIRKRVKMVRSASMDDHAEEYNVKAELAKDFETALQRRIREDERMVNAAKSIAQQEEEYRERMIEMRERKEEKCRNVREKVEKTRKIKIQKLDLSQKVAERRSDIEKTDLENRQGKSMQIANKMEDTERKRIQLSTERNQRTINLNEIYHQRQNSCIEYKLKMENVGIPDLSMIEEKLYSSAVRRKYRNFNIHHHKGGYISVGSTERLQRVKEEDEATRQKILQKIVDKLAKERNFELTRQQQREHLREISPTTERAMEHSRRMDEIKEFEDMRESKFIEDVREKDLRSVERVKRNRVNLEDYITERRELWAQKNRECEEHKIMG